MKRETNNSHYVNAVAVYREDVIVGHIPFNLVPRLSAFLRRDVNKVFAEVAGAKVNRGAGYGLEVHCTYWLYGPKVYIDRMKELVDSLLAAGLIAINPIS